MNRSSPVWSKRKRYKPIESNTRHPRIRFQDVDMKLDYRYNGCVLHGSGVRNNCPTQFPSKVISPGLTLEFIAHNIENILNSAMGRGFGTPRPRLGRGPPVDFVQQLQKIQWKIILFAQSIVDPPVHRGILIYGDGPFVPVPKSGLLGYRSEERKTRSISDWIGNLYELDRLEFSFPPTGVFQIAKRR